MSQKNPGFTLIELLITLAIVGILAMIAIPTYSYLMQESRAMGAANEISAALALARSEAIKQGLPVTFCDADTTVAAPNCTGAINGATNLANGWLVFTDQGTIGTIDGTDAIIRMGDPQPTNVVISTSGFNAYVQYSATGFLNIASFNMAATPAPPPAYVEICATNPLYAGGGTPRLLSINIVGRISITNVTFAGASTC